MNHTSDNIDIQGELATFIKLLLIRVNNKLINNEDITSGELSTVSKFIHTNLLESLFNDDGSSQSGSGEYEEMKKILSAIDGFLKGKVALEE